MQAHFEDKRPSVKWGPLLTGGLQQAGSPLHKEEGLCREEALCREEVLCIEQTLSKQETVCR